MGNVINFDAEKNREKDHGKPLDYEELSYYKKLLEVKANLLDELFSLMEEMLQGYGYDPGRFSLDKESAYIYLNTNMLKFEYEGEDLSIMYDACVDGVSYKACAWATHNDHMLELKADLYKKDGEEWLLKDGEEWLSYNGISWEKR
ncbi:MAG: hypothetical protein LUF92_16545 [Clostridiales bacterium]|nr:hypothetical protein [Clostridiales bacterium]